MHRLLLVGETLQNPLINECESGRKPARNTWGRDSSCIGKTLNGWNLKA